METMELAIYVFTLGQISVQRAILCVNKYKKRYSESVAAYCEEAIVRRELSDNFCFYNENYDSLKGLAGWALQTLNDHKYNPFNATNKLLLSKLVHSIIGKIGVNIFTLALSWKRQRLMMTFGTQHKFNYVKKEKCMASCECIGRRKYLNGRRVPRKHWKLLFI